MTHKITRRSLVKQVGAGVTLIAAGTGTVAARGGGKRNGARAEKDIVETAEELEFTEVLGEFPGA